MHSQSPNTFTLSLKSVWNSSLINYLDRANCGNRGALSKIRASVASDFAQLVIMRSVFVKCAVFCVLYE